jgi:hypothetical protein
MARGLLRRVKNKMARGLLRRVKSKKDIPFFYFFLLENTSVIINSFVVYRHILNCF